VLIDKTKYISYLKKGKDLLGLLTFGFNSSRIGGLDISMVLTAYTVRVGGWIVQGIYQSFFQISGHLGIFGELLGNYGRRLLRG